MSTDEAVVATPAKTQAAELRRLQDELARYQKVERGEFDGFTLCPNQSCKSFDSLKPLAVVKDRIEFHDPDSGRLDHTSEYVRAVADEDIPCPECGTMRAVLESRPPAHPQIAPR